jgi:hypothetical protein
MERTGTERKKHFIQSIIDQGKQHKRSAQTVSSCTANWMRYQLKAHWNHPIDVQMAFAACDTSQNDSQMQLNGITSVIRCLNQRWRWW